MTIAFWCVLVAALLPIVSVGIAKWGADLDNNHPRDWAQSLQGYRRRAFAAHQNAFEFFPFFSAAVIVAHVTQAPQGVVDTLSLAVIAARILYLALYVADLATWRSIVWLISLGGSIAIFAGAAWAI